VGKSTVASVLALHRAFYYEKSTILLISPTLRQSQELLRKVQDWLPNLPIKASLVGDSKTIVEFSNRSRIIGLPSNEGNIRSFTADLIIEDESGDVEDALYMAVLPMLIVSQGKLVMMGTPRGRRGHFFECWERKAGWEKYEIPFTQVPRIPPADIARDRIAMGERFASEYECQFTALGGGLVYTGFDEKRNLIDQLPMPKNRLHQWTYLLGLDFGFRDSTAFVLVGYLPADPCLYVVMSHKQTTMIADDIAKKIDEIQALYPIEIMVGDSEGYGKGPIEELRRRHHIPVEPATKTGKSGYMDLLNGDLQTGRVKLLRPTNPKLYEEITQLAWNDKRTNQRDGSEDHLCDALLYVWRRGTQYLNEPEKEAPKTKEEAIRREMTEYWEKYEAQVAQEKNEEAFMEYDPLGDIDG